MVRLVVVLGWAAASSGAFRAPASCPPVAPTALLRSASAGGAEDEAFDGGGAVRPLTFTSPRRVDAALRRNDPLLFLASRLIRDDDARRGVRSVYAWCRRADDVADEVGANRALALASLDEIEADFDAALRGGPRNAIDAALAATFAAYPRLDRELFSDMLDGMRSDLEAESLRFAAWDPDLRRYCERVAGGVGLMLLPLLGAADASRDTRARAVDLGVAIQLTNVLRDVGADARDYDRVYLPLADLEACGSSVADVRERNPTTAYRAAVAVSIGRARELYASARLALPDLPAAARFPVAAIIELLEAVLSELEARGGDSLTAKVRPDRAAVLGAVWRAWRAS